MYAYDETLNLIEVRGRGVKIITFLLDHNLSYEDNTCYGKLLCSTLSIAFIIYVGKALLMKSIYNASFLTDAVMRTVSVGTVSIRTIYMAIIVAL